MTRRNLFPAIALLIGIVLGVFGANSFSSSQKAGDAQPHRVPSKSSSTSSGNLSNSSDIPAGQTNGSHPSSGSFTGSAESLLSLIPAHYSSSPSLQFLNAVEGLTKNQIAQLFEELQESPSQTNHVRMALGSLVRRWAQLDPETALAAVQDFSDRSRRGTPVPYCC